MIGNDGEEQGHNNTHAALRKARTTFENEHKDAQERTTTLALKCGPRKTSTPVGFEPTRGDPIGLAGRRLSHSAKVSVGLATHSRSQVETDKTPACDERLARATC